MKFNVLRVRYFKSVAKSMSDSGHDDISVELDSTAFSTKVPTNKLGHPIVGGITDLGLEVCLSLPI